MKRIMTLLGGLITALPFTYIAYFMFSVTVSMINPTSIENTFAIIAVLHALVILLGVILFIFYMSHLFKNERIDKDKRIMWVIILIFGWAISMPVYWYLYCWKTTKQEQAIPTK